MLNNKITKFNNIQALRGIAALAVVFFHFHNCELAFGHGIHFLPNFFGLGCAGVDIFFVISGFIMTTITLNQFQHVPAIKNFAINRVSRIYPLYWFCTLIQLILMYFSHGSLPHFNLMPAFLLLPTAIPLPLAVAWTLIFEVYFYCVIAILLFFSEKLFIPLLILWGALIITLGKLSNGSPYFGFYASPICFEFIGGCLVARFLYTYSAPKSIGMLSLLVGVATLSIGFALYTKHFGTLPNSWTRVALFGGSACLILYGAVTIERMGLIASKTLSYLGDISYSIYLIHYIILIGFGRFMVNIQHDKIIYHIGLLVTALFFILFFSGLTYQYLEKPLIAFFRKKIVVARPVLS